MVGDGGSITVLEQFNAKVVFEKYRINEEATKNCASGNVKAKRPIQHHFSIVHHTPNAIQHDN